MQACRRYSALSKQAWTRGTSGFVGRVRGLAGRRRHRRRSTVRRQRCRIHDESLPGAVDRGCCFAQAMNECRVARFDSGHGEGWGMGERKRRMGKSGLPVGFRQTGGNRQLGESGEWDASKSTMERWMEQARRSAGREGEYLIRGQASAAPDWPARTEQRARCGNVSADGASRNWRGAPLGVGAPRR